jgi:hypothetical protein
MYIRGGYPYGAFGAGSSPESHSGFRGCLWFELRPTRLLGGLCDVSAQNAFCGTKANLRGVYSPHAMRKIGSKQGWNCALVIILWAGGLQLSLYAQQVAKLSPKVMAVVNAPPVDLKDDDAPLLRLKKERFNAALNEAKARFDLYSRGFDANTRTDRGGGERLFGAEVDLYDKPEEKAQVLQRQLDVYNEAEANLQKQVRQGLATQADLERLRYNRLSVEIDLFNNKKRPR